MARTSHRKSRHIRQEKRAARLAGVSYFGRVNSHMLDNPVLAVTREDDRTVITFYGGMVAILYAAS